MYTATELVAAKPVAQGASSRRMRIVALALLAIAAACVASSLSQSARGDAGGMQATALYLGASEEGGDSQAIETAKHIYPNQVTAKNPAVDPNLVKEVAKAEAEQAAEQEAESAFASGKEHVAGKTKPEDIPGPDDIPGASQE